MRAMKAAVIIACAMLLATAAWAATPAFKTMTMELPPDAAAFPDGPNVKTVTQNCLACHSADMVLDQPLLPRATWAAEVTKMRNVYKAPIGDADAALIVDYLAATHAPP
jgi:sulfite dehydrogenase (cytochrome) subunit B